MREERRYCGGNDLLPVLFSNQPLAYPLGEYWFYVVAMWTLKDIVGRNFTRKRGK